MFGCPCFILKCERDQVDKFDSKADERIFLGYSTSSQAFRIYNKRTIMVEESIREPKEQHQENINVDLQGTSR